MKIIRAKLLIAFCLCDLAWVPTGMHTTDIIDGSSFLEIIYIGSALQNNLGISIHSNQYVTCILDCSTHHTFSDLPVPFVRHLVVSVLHYVVVTLLMPTIDSSIAILNMFDSTFCLLYCLISWST